MPSQKVGNGEGIVRLFIAFCVCIVTSVPSVALAGIVNGVELNRLWPEFVKAMNRDPSVDFMQAVDFRAYVDGVVDSLDGIKFCTPDHGTSGQFSTIVGQYLEKHPEEWTEPGPVLVSKALSKPFPCK